MDVKAVAGNKKATHMALFVDTNAATILRCWLIPVFLLSVIHNSKLGFECACIVFVTASDDSQLERLW